MRYARFLSGTLSVDAAIVNEENLEKIAANRDRLLASERFGSWDGKGADTQLLYYRQEDGGNEPVLVGHIGLNGSGFPEEYRKVYLEYERTGLLDALWGFGRLGECCVTLCGVSEHCAVWIRDYDADGTDRHTSRFAKRWKSSMEAPAEQISAGAEFCPGGENARRD